MAFQAKRGTAVWVALCVIVLAGAPAAMSKTGPFIAVDGAVMAGPAPAGAESAPAATTT